MFTELAIRVNTNIMGLDSRLWAALLHTLTYDGEEPTLLYINSEQGTSSLYEDSRLNIEGVNYFNNILLQCMKRFNSLSTWHCHNAFVSQFTDFVLITTAASAKRITMR